MAHIERQRSDHPIVDIVNALEAYGHDPQSYQLNDHIDLDALVQLVDSVYGDVTVRFTVGNTAVIVTQERIRVVPVHTHHMDEPSG